MRPCFPQGVGIQGQFGIQVCECGTGMKRSRRADPRAGVNLGSGSHGAANGGGGSEFSAPARRSEVSQAALRLCKAGKWRMENGKSPLAKGAGEAEGSSP